MHRRLLVAASLVSTLFAAAPLHAKDLCRDQGTGRTYDCDQPPPSPQAQPGQPAYRQATGLRDQLQKALNSGGTGAAPSAAADQAGKRWADASSRATEASASAQLTSDP